MDTVENSRVLVVDDEPQITRVLKTVLSSQGYDVRTAAEGESALANFKEWSPELVITDLYMPHMDGVELCRRIRELSSVPIIVLSVKGEERTKVEALDSGADDYVTKPFGIDELMARVRAALRRNGGAASAGTLVIRGWRFPDRHGCATRAHTGPRGPADAEGVRSVRLHGEAPEPGADARRAARGGVGPGVAGAARIPARLHGAAAQEARAGSVEPPLSGDGAVGRVPVQSEGVTDGRGHAEDKLDMHLPRRLQHSEADAVPGAYAILFCGALLSLVVGFWSPVIAQGGIELSGTWSIDRAASQFPRDVGFDADFLPAGGAGASGGAAAPERVPLPALRPQGESFDTAQRRQLLTDEVRNPSARLTIVDTPASVAITDEKGRTRTLHPDGRAESLQLADGVSVLTNARRDGGRLVVLYSVGDLRQLRYTYSRAENAGPLIVDVAFIERGGAGDTVRRVYMAGESGGAARPSSTGSASTTGSGSGSPSGGAPGSPAVPRAGSEFTGLTRLGVVVEELGAQAMGCGLKREALESAVAKPFSDAGLKTATNSDEDTYVHVTLMTSTLPNGMCISRYDWSIYSMTEATLSYQRTPQLTQVLLAHKGGLTGSMPAAHAADVVRGITDGLTQIAGIIRDANR